MKRIVLLALVCAFSVSASAQAKFLQKMKMLSGDSMAINVSEVRYAVRLPSGACRLFYGFPTTVYETQSSFTSVVSGSCGNLVQFTQIIGNTQQIVAINPKHVARAAPATIPSRTILFMHQSGEIRVVSGPYQVVSGLLSNCLIGGGGGGPTYTAGAGIAISGGNVISNIGDLSDTNEIQVLSILGQDLTLSNGGGTVTIPGSGAILTDSTIDGTGTIGDSLRIAQQGATPGQVLKWNGTSWAPSADGGATDIYYVEDRKSVV